MSHWSIKYASIPYELHGRTQDSVDCWGLVYLIFAEVFNIDIPSYTEDVKPLLQSDKPSKVFKQVWNNYLQEDNPWSEQPRLSEQSPKEGDLLLMNLRTHGGHVGILIDDNGTMKLLHCTSVIGTTIQPLTNNPLWDATLKHSQVYRHRRLI